MTGGWKAVENQTQVYHRFPPALEIARAIPTFPPPRRLLDSFRKAKRKETSSAIASDRLQAHLSIGKHCSFQPVRQSGIRTSHEQEAVVQYVSDFDRDERHWEAHCTGTTEHDSFTSMPAFMTS
jgi:hypothetical protein